MKTGSYRQGIFIAVIGLWLFACGCVSNSANTVIDEASPIEGQHWSYVNQVKYTFTITDESDAFNLYLNLRVTSDYKYSNMFVFVHQTGPDKKQTTVRHEVTLAKKDGEWLGTGTGNFFNYQVLLKRNYHFPKKGIYTIAIEQNMRDNPLYDVSDVGLRVEKAQ